MARSPGGEKLRVFVAVELPDAVKAEFAGLTAAIDALGVRGARTVRPEGIHLTLKFLGDVERRAYSRNTSPPWTPPPPNHSLSISRSETRACSPIGARRAYCGSELRAILDTPEPSATLRGARAWPNLGFRPERRGFNPHITAGRITGQRIALGQAQSDRRALLSHECARPSIRVESISLIRSTLRPDGAIYEPIYSASLRAVQSSPRSRSQALP